MLLRLKQGSSHLPSFAHWLGVAAQALLVLVFSVSNVSGQAEITASDGAVWRYYLSFGFDYCGDPDVGKRQRVVIEALVDECEVLRRDKNSILGRFHQVESEARKAMREQEANDSERQSGSEPMEKAFGELFVCGSESYQAQVIEFSRSFSRFELGQSSAVDILNVDPALCKRVN